MKGVLIATQKPFAPQTINKMKEVITGGGFEFSILVCYTDKKELTKALINISGLMLGAISLMKKL